MVGDVWCGGRCEYLIFFAVIVLKKEPVRVFFCEVVSRCANN